jgi:hypothetical protein
MNPRQIDQLQAEVNYYRNRSALREQSCTDQA